MLDSSPDGLLLVAGDGSIRLANRSAGSIFGYDVEQLVEMRVEELVPVENSDRHAAHRANYLSRPERRPMGTDLRLLARYSDGDLFPVEISLSPITLDGEVHTIATVRDVSERQEALARVALMNDRERIARDLHDMVIQRLFAAGMSLQAVTSMIESPVALARISAVTDELDETIHELRTAIFQLGHPEQNQSLSSHLNELVHERSRQLGFMPQLVVKGDIDDLPELVGEQLIATLTEALSNVARHAGATSAVVRILLPDDQHVVMSVTDDGVGISGAPKAKGGLSNMMWRAAELGGTCSVSPSDPSGTSLVWSVPR